MHAVSHPPLTPTPQQHHMMHDITQATHQLSSSSAAETPQDKHAERLSQPPYSHAWSLDSLCTSNTHTISNLKPPDVGVPIAERQIARQQRNEVIHSLFESCPTPRAKLLGTSARKPASGPASLDNRRTKGT